MKFRLAVPLALVLAIPAKNAFAWGAPGHMEVAAVAWSQMTPKAQAKAWELLQKHKYFPKWTEIMGPWATKPEKERNYFMLAATWPDYIRGDDDFAADNKPAPKTPVWPGFPDMWKHTSWHFVDTPYILYASLEAPKTQMAPRGDLEEAIPLMKAKMMSGTPDQQAFAMPWLEHLVGDIHQPLHCVSRYSKYDLNKKFEAVSDMGGNRMKVRYKGKEKKLHTLWDDIVGKPNIISLKPYKENYAKDFDTVEATLPQVTAVLADPEVTAWAKDDVVGRWRLESTDYAIRNVYSVVGFDVPNQPLPEVTENTYAVWQQYGYKRVAASGLRLAAILNAALGN